MFQEYVCPILFKNIGTVGRQTRIEIKERGQRSHILTPPPLPPPTRAAEIQSETCPWFRSSSSSDNSSLNPTIEAR